MVLREKLQTDLEILLGNRNVYFQPPDNFQMKYPCIVYSLEGSYKVYADNIGYVYRNRYNVTYITRNPDDGVYEKLNAIPLSRFDRPFTSDGLHHFVFSIYY